MKGTIWYEVALIAENLLSIYEQIIELSHEIQYINEDQTLEEGCAGDNLKDIAAEMMDQLQKLKPLDY